MEEFLNSEVFEKMAMEYNKKYGGVSLLKVADINGNRFGEIARDIHKLLLMLDTATQGHPSFELYRQKKSLLIGSLESIAKELGIVINDVEVDRKVNNKNCLELLFSIIRSLFSLHNDRNFEKLEKILTSIFDVTSAFYSVF